VLGPIFAREFLTVPRRAAHYTGRAVALGMLWTLGVTAWLATGGLGGAEPGLGDTAHFGLLLFQLFTVVTLVLVAFFAALSAASTVAREKDRRTFILLLLTDMTDAEIVLGKLLGTLLPIGLMLIGMLPVLAMLLLLGGITPAQVVNAWLVLLFTAFAAGSLGGLVALWRDKTFQSLALAVLALVLYVCAVQALGLFSYFADSHPEASAVSRSLAGVDWPAVQMWLDPVRAIFGILQPEHAGGFRVIYGYVGVMMFWSVLLNAWGVYKLRKWNPGGEPIMQRETPEEEEAKDRAKAHAAPGAVRGVWGNPVLWREIRTRAYGRRPLIVKLGYFIVAGLIAYAALAPVLAGQRVAYAAGYGMIPVTVLSLLLLAAQATTAITSERDGRSLDLLLATDLTPKEFIFGKIGGILYNTKEFLLPPLILASLYSWLGVLATPPANALWRRPEMNAVNFAAVSGGLIIVFAFVLALGIHVALRNVNSRQAISHALGTVFFLSVGTMICIYLILINPGSFEYQFISFSLFLIVGIGGLWWVLSADRPTTALTLASIVLPVAMFYCVTNVLVAQPGSQASAPPLIPFVVIAASFGFTILAMLVPMLSEFDVAFGRTHAQE
jgi:ABC-type transport system involved in multi-copper enzyme maturation permease subunit